MRIKFLLSRSEKKELHKLKPEPGIAFDFWGRIALSRNLDYRSIMLIDGELSGLPRKHNQYWCYPLPLICKKSPVYEE